MFILALCLAVFETGLSQQETCQADVVVTSQGALKRQIKREIATAFRSFTCVTDGSVATPATGVLTGGQAEQAIARIENKLDDITDKLDSLEKRMDALHELGSTPCHAAGSCAEILEKDRSSPSGYYWVTNGTGHAHSVYCDMTRSCGGVTGGWMRVAYLDMTNSSHQCPSGLRQRTDSGVRSCAASSDTATCSSVLYRSHGIQYSRVCGKIIAYQANTVDGFFAIFRAREPRIDSNYVDGVSLTHGNPPRKHIWSFAAGPCPGRAPAPAFVNNHYFTDGLAHRQPLDVHNPLWDGVDCGTNTCCRLNNPPWFHRQFPQPTADDIEMRVCRDQERGDEDVAIKVIEIYVQGFAESLQQGV